MQSSLLLQLLILLVVANATAVVAKKLFGGAFARPLDGGALNFSTTALMSSLEWTEEDVMSVTSLSGSHAIAGHLSQSDRCAMAGRFRTPKPPCSWR